jgi:hypothetical protein
MPGAMVLRSLLLTRARSPRHAAAVLAELPVYQIALWPDGWALGDDGAVSVHDTHAMAEARRWFALAGRNAQGRTHRPLCDVELHRAMRMHGVFVPRPVVDMAGRRFVSEQVASVAMQLVAGDWIGERRRALMSTPERALAERALAWTGSRHAGPLLPDTALQLLSQALADCIGEGLLPTADYRLRARADDGFGIRSCRCCVEADGDPDRLAQVRDALSTALIPWNRVVIRDGTAAPLITLQVRARRAASDGRHVG